LNSKLQAVELSTVEKSLADRWTRQMNSLEHSSEIIKKIKSKTKIFELQIIQ
jgi:hypothetical protein